MALREQTQANLIWAAMLFLPVIAVVLMLTCCGTVQRYDTHPSVYGGFVLQDCLYDRPLTAESIPKLCKTLCTSQTRIGAELVEKGVCK